MTYWHCKKGVVTEVSKEDADRLEANGEKVTSDPFEAAKYLGDNDY